MEFLKGHWQAAALKSLANAVVRRPCSSLAFRALLQTSTLLHDNLQSVRFHSDLCTPPRPV
jgi:hypothetical protein